LLAFGPAFGRPSAGYGARLRRSPCHSPEPKRQVSGSAPPPYVGSAYAKSQFRLVAAKLSFCFRWAFARRFFWASPSGGVGSRPPVAGRAAFASAVSLGLASRCRGPCPSPCPLLPPGLWPAAGGCARCTACPGGSTPCYARRFAFSEWLARFRGFLEKAAKLRFANFFHRFTA